ncbi:MAG: hypothetical protein IKT42_03815 [Clostridia bacterium]|nr:hypothetical protein [Clostridia bacterium]
MKNYVGKTCPFCRTPFTEDDDIVICSSCEMPHHKDCWIENQGCTTFGCMGTINSATNTPNTVTTNVISYNNAPEFVFCTRCGARHAAGLSFCSKCGTPLRKNTPPQTMIR